MKYAIAFCLFIATLSLHAQCNFDQMIVAGDTAAGRGDFRGALKKYNSARRCDPSRERLVDDRVEKLFDNIQKLKDEAVEDKKRADTLAEVARKAKSKAEYLRGIAENESKKNIVLTNRADSLRIIADTARQRADDKARFLEKAIAANQRCEKNTDYQTYIYLGQEYWNKKAPDSALICFNHALEIVESIQQKEPVDLLKISDVQQKIALVIEGRDKTIIYNRLVGEADSLKSTNLKAAYGKTIEAYRLGVDTSDAVHRLDDLESNLHIQSRLDRAISFLRGDGRTYYDLLYQSAEANLLLKHSKAAKRKIDNIMKLHQYDISFITNPVLKQYADIYTRSFVPRVQIYLAYDYYLSSNLGWLKKFDRITVGDKIYIKNRSGIGFDISYQKNSGKELAIAQSLSKWEANAYYSHTILRLKNRKWKNYRLKADGVAGLSLGTSKIELKEQYLPYFAQTPALYGKISSTGYAQFSEGDLKLKYREVSNDYIVECQYQAPLTKGFANVFTGLDVSIKPYPYFDVWFFGAVTYSFQVLPWRPVKEYAVKSALESHFKSRFQLTPDEVSALGSNLESVGIKDNYQIKTHYPQYDSGWQIKAGVRFSLFLE